MSSAGMFSTFDVDEHRGAQLAEQISRQAESLRSLAPSARCRAARERERSRRRPYRGIRRRRSVRAATLTSGTARALAARAIAPPDLVRASQYGDEAPGGGGDGSISPGSIRIGSIRPGSSSDMLGLSVKIGALDPSVLALRRHVRITSEARARNSCSACVRSTSPLVLHKRIFLPCPAARVPAKPRLSCTDRLPRPSPPRAPFWTSLRTIMASASRKRMT